MNTKNHITKKQKHLLEKYGKKYGKDYLLSYLHEFYPEANWETLTKEEAQKIITGRKSHEKQLKINKGV